MPVRQIEQVHLESQLAMAYQTYLTNWELIVLEETNEGIAKQNLITLDKFPELETTTTIEFRTAAQLCNCKSVAWCTSQANIRNCAERIQLALISN
jgi:hypothetical protein